MSKGYRDLREYIQLLKGDQPAEAFFKNLGPQMESPAVKVPKTLCNTLESANAIWDTLPLPPKSREILCDSQALQDVPAYDTNIENYIGTVKVPIGLAGPLRVNGLYAHGDYYIPLATTEAALVASYNRSAQLISEVGGCTAMLLSEGVSRVPVFVFENMKESGIFVNWALINLESFRTSAESTTRHGKLQDMRISVAGNCVYLGFDYLTGDASGQNMVTIATDAIMKYILHNTPVKPLDCYIESNMSGDKKACAQSFQLVRGKKVTAETVIPKELLESRFNVTPQKLFQYTQLASLGGILSGTMGVQAQFANALAALFIACGQDVGCVAESAVGVSRFDVTTKGDLYASVTLPNLMVGTVGGGTGLPSQKACLDILGVSGTGHAREFAEVAAGLVLCGEISLASAICTGQFTRAHDLLARMKKKRPE